MSFSFFQFETKPMRQLTEPRYKIRDTQKKDKDIEDKKEDKKKRTSRSLSGRRQQRELIRDGLLYNDRDNFLLVECQRHYLGGRHQIYTLCLLLLIFFSGVRYSGDLSETIVHAPMTGNYSRPPRGRR
ncbi:hypothetical protein CDAR_454541 [Caerostris darwini]|uniref:Uncharacterized protein n=1 Tax=Caerostris darwini TaxID=1538125 RepID=A0AAV4TVV7_9ARAC|nr:hypothetical protein CDAR_454541 [Caerostris darwini]